MSRVGLGCMRLSTDPDRDEDRARRTIEAALDAGARWLDTGHAYGRSAAEAGDNERLIASVLRERPEADVRIVTKCGMTRPDGRWEPDGRASSILADARASAVALGRPPDILLLHAPDPAVDLATSVRALVRAREEGLARAIGLSNVSRGQLEAIVRTSAAPLAIAAVEIALGAYDDAGARGGVIAWCKAHGAAVLAHAPLGGPARAARVEGDRVLQAVARRHRATPAQIVLAYLLAVDEIIVPIPGARRPETAASAIAAGGIVLAEEDLAALDARFPGLAMTRRPPRAPSPETAAAEVVLVMGLAGSGKTRLAETYVERGYARLNRDSLGGTLKGIARRLAELLAGGTTRAVLDNTYITRASRSEIVRVAHAASAIVRCVHVDAPPHEAQVNATWRMLERHGELLGGADLTTRAKTDPNLFAPSALFRMERQLERPSLDEGFASIELVSFAREHRDGASGVAIPIELVLLERGGVLGLRDDPLPGSLPASAPVLLFGWRPSPLVADDAWRERAGELARQRFAGHPLEIGVCAHAAGPPVCWCRPPLPGLWLAFARRHGIDGRRSALYVVTPSHRTMARTLSLEAREVLLPGSR